MEDFIKTLRSYADGGLVKRPDLVLAIRALLDPPVAPASTSTASDCRVPIEITIQGALCVGQEAVRLYTRMEAIALRDRLNERIGEMK